MQHRTIKNLAAVALALIFVATQALAQDVSPQVDKSVAAALNFLVRQQNPDGSFDASGPRIAFTGLSLMSFLAAGNVPDEGKYGPVVRGAMDYLIRTSPADGYWGRIDGSRMYGQGIATLALAEAYGADHDPAHQQAARAVLQRAAAVIFKAQDATKSPLFAGGWRYEPTNPDSDLSLSGWCALALRAAANVGLDVPHDRVVRALAFVQRCYRADQNGFAYQPGRDASIAMTGVGILNLYLLQAADASSASISLNAPQLQPAGKFLQTHPVLDSTPMPYYAIYYATQAAFQAGGQTWDAVWSTTQARLLGAQNPDGGFPQSASSEEPGRVYATSMAVLSLAVPYRLLPIYQR
jgi:hypothetical protein